MRRMTQYWGALGLALGLLFAAGPALAHPHVWVDLETKPVFDADGNVTGLEIAWIFDPFYTVFAIEEQRTEDGVDQDGLVKMVAGNLQRLKPYNYFTDVRAGGAKLPLGTVETFNAGLLKDKLWMQFVVMFETPVDPRETGLSYAVYDPTYYIDISYQDRQKANLNDASAPGCEASLEEASPTFEAITLAQSLDQSATGPETLGEMFAERVRIECN